MPVFETYAARVAAAAKAGASDVYVYDTLPSHLRKQLSQILTDCIGPGWDPGPYSGTRGPRHANDKWELISKIMDKEIKSFSLPNRRVYAYGHCIQYLVDSEDVDGVLSFIEICCKMMDRVLSDDPGGYKRRERGATQDTEDGLAELNQRFLNAGVGFQFENEQIIRVDSQYVHVEVVKEALRLLHEADFAAANTEFLTAHRHLREGNLRDCNTAALRAMESVLKVICDARGWAFNKGDTVERLLAVVRANGLFPDDLGGYFDNLIGAMKAGGPRIRDRQGAHGAAPGDGRVPDHIGAFALHLTAANLVMLVKAHRSMP